MNCVIRQESPADYHTVHQLIKDAFQSVPQSNQTEHDIVARLRNSPAFVNGLSLVAELDGVVIAHILLSKVLIKNEDSEFECLSLAPVSVTPKFQKQGVGSQLIKHAHREAKDLGYTAVVLVGHASYYPRFGYVPSIEHNITFPFDSPAVNCMVKELVPNALLNVSGEVEYPKEFFGR